VLGGGLQIDAPDLARFGWFVLNGWVVSDSVRDNRLWRSLTDGLRTWSNTRNNAPPVGLAWEVRNRNGRRVAEHGGSWVGARSHLAVYRDDGLVIAILSNQRDSSQPPPAPPPGGTRATPPVNHDVSDLAHQLARIVLNNWP
jgi:CubicO group peptidase (beta-lactamase class C family)